MKLDQLRDILVLIAKNQPVRKAHLITKCEKEGLLKSESKNRRLSSSRIYHYTAALDCMEFVRRIKVQGLGEYYTVRKPHGEAFTKIARFKSAISLTERAAFAEALFRCDATKRILTFFVKDSDPTSYGEFLNTAHPAYMIEKPGSLTLVSDYSSKSQRLTSSYDLISIRWGSLQMCLNVGVVDDLRIRSSEHVPKEKTHVVFPVDMLRAWTLKSFGDFVKRMIIKWGRRPGILSMPELIYHGCVEGRIQIDRFHMLLQELYSAEPAKFYFDRVPSVPSLGFAKGYPMLGGQHRSVVRLISR